MENKLEQAWELMKKLDRKDILELTARFASTRNLMQDLLEVYSEDLDELIEECKELLVK